MNNSKSAARHRQNGSLLLLTILILAVVGAGATALVTVIGSDYGVSVSQRDGVRAFYAAETGVDQAANDLLGADGSSGAAFTEADCQALNGQGGTLSGIGRYTIEFAGYNPAEESCTFNIVGATPESGTASALRRIEITLSDAHIQDLDDGTSGGTTGELTEENWAGNFDVRDDGTVTFRGGSDINNSGASGTVAARVHPQGTPAAARRPVYLWVGIADESAPVDAFTLDSLDLDTFSEGWQGSDAAELADCFGERGGSGNSQTCHFRGDASLPDFGDGSGLSPYDFFDGSQQGVYRWRLGTGPVRETFNQPSFSFGAESSGDVVLTYLCIAHAFDDCPGARRAQAPTPPQGWRED